MKKNEAPASKETKIGWVSRIFGFRDVKNGLGSVADGLAESGERTVSLFQKYREAMFGKRVARVETFEEAVARLGLSEQDLESRRSELSRAALLFLAIDFVVFYFFVQSVSEMRWGPAFTQLTFILTISAVVFSQRFRVWQIDQRRLGSPKEFIDGVFGR